MMIKIEFLTKLMLYYEQEWLSEEWKEWIPKKSELEGHKWWVSQKDLVKDGKAYQQVLFPSQSRIEEKSIFRPILGFGSCYCCFFIVFNINSWIS